ncbi:MAG: hypothetical protein JWO58_2913 [Chitinophagaceae bacterium]|nr:hypothetical protein [Chitinophagaceae bacterium]
MGKKVLHIVFVLLLVLAVPLSHIAKPAYTKTIVKQEKTSTESSKETSKTFLQPQVIHAHVSHAHVLTPCIPDHHRFEIFFPQEETSSSACTTWLDKGTSKFFKTLFRHFIATQAP